MRRLLLKGLLSAAAMVLAVALSLTNAHAVEAAKAADKAKTGAKAAAGAKVDINSASQAELEKLPGVGAATAKKIIAGRPYASTADLSKAGVSARTIEKITPLVAVGAAPAAAPLRAEDGGPQGIRSRCAGYPGCSGCGQSRQAGPASSRRQRHGLGKSRFENLPQRGEPMVRQDQAGLLHDGGGGDKGGLPRVQAGGEVTGLGSETLQNLAAKAGISTEEVTAKLSELLPDLIDKMTPDGVIPEGGVLEKGMEFLKSKFS